MQSERRRRTSGVLVAGIAVCVLSLVALIVALLYVFKPFGIFEEPIRADKPSLSQVESIISSTNFDDPDLSSFKYVNTSDLKGPKLTNYKVEDVTYSQGSGRDIYCEASADAEFSNDFIAVTEPINVRLNYDKDTEEWNPEKPYAGKVTAKPLAAPDMEEIKANLDNIIKSYDTSAASAFEGAESTMESDVNKDGGTATFNLSKPNEDTGDVATCTVNTDISWDDTRGWVVAVKSIDGIETPEPEAAAEQNPDAQASADANPAQTTPAPSPQAPSSSSSSSGGLVPTMQLTYNSGELAQIPGVVVFSDGGRVLLRTDSIIRVIYNGRTFVVAYFELSGNHRFVRDEHISIIGEITDNGTLPEAPLVLNVD